MRTESKTNYVVQVNHDGTHKTGISGENLGKLAAASPPAGGIAFGQKESALLFRVLYPSSWESFIPKSLTKPTSAPKASPSGKRLSGSGDTRPGAILRFSPISTYSYPATLQREALVTFLAHNAGSPPANVKWQSGTTYWVNWEDLVDEVLCVILTLFEHQSFDYSSAVHTSDMIYDTITPSPAVWHAQLMLCGCLSVSRSVPYSRLAKIQARLAKMLWCCCKVPAEEAACATGPIKSLDSITASPST